MNRVLLRLGYRIPDLHDADSLAGLEQRQRAAQRLVTTDPVMRSRRWLGSSGSTSVYPENNAGAVLADTGT